MILTLQILAFVILTVWPWLDLINDADAADAELAELYDSFE